MKYKQYAEKTLLDLRGLKYCALMVSADYILDFAIYILLLPIAYYDIQDIIGPISITQSLNVVFHTSV